MDFETYQNLIEQTKTRLDDGVSARFYDRIIKTQEMDANGIPKFKCVCYCEIRIKDNTTEIFDQPATKEKIERFPVEYARYQLSKKQIQQGTPLQEFTFLTLSEIETCKYHGIFTLEALTQLDKEKAKALNLLKEQDLACKFLENGKKLKTVNDIEEIKKSYEEQIAKLRNEIEKLKIQNFSSSKRRKK